ncbi:PH domain-containing protein [Fodinicola acaciae]|uniref:PH domain-containing protein n=1 Tax=Fodinicola acaciae TaxID=2681555 RepID=UPI0013CFB413|nr:PH domain-containing protein [Fodinicola acaciae]
MRFPEKLLDEDERLVLHLHPHWKTLVPAVFVLLLTVGLASYAIAAWPYTSLRVLVAIIAAAVIVWYVGRRLVRWLTTHVVFTSERVIVRVGLIRRHRWELPLGAITDVAYAGSIVGRMVGCGTLIVQAAGDDENEGGQLTLVDLPRAREIQTILYELMEEEDERALAEDEEEDLGDNGDDEFPHFGNHRGPSPVVRLDQPE